MVLRDRVCLHGLSLQGQGGEGTALVHPVAACREPGIPSGSGRASVLALTSKEQHPKGRSGRREQTRRCVGDRVGQAAPGHPRCQVSKGETSHSAGAPDR